MISRFFKIFLLFFIVILFGTQVRYAVPQKEIWLVKSASSLQVDGRTNVNHFSCRIASYGRLDTLVCEPSHNPEAIKVKSKIAIPVSRFDCGMKMMTKDLQKTLKHEEFPLMYIEFKQFSRRLSEADGTTPLVGLAEIYLAGITQKYQIHCSSKRVNDTEIELRGSRNIQFTDFYLKPPSKLGGANQVEDQMIVHFILQLKKISLVKGTF